VLVEDPQDGVVDFDGDGGAGVAEAHLQPLPDDLDSAAAGHPSLHPDRGGAGG
jgi:hypothetical protein